MGAGAQSAPAPTIRLRLTLLYGAVFLVTGAVLLTIGYLLVRHNLRPYGRTSATRLRKLGLPTPRSSAALLGFAPRFRSLGDRPGGSARSAGAANALHRLLFEYVAALGAMTGISVAAGWLLARPGARAAARDHRDRAARVGREPRRADRARGAGRRAARSSPTRSTACSAGSTRPLPASATSSPTPRTSCARRWRSCGPRSTWRSPIPTRASRSCGRWGRRYARRSTAASR